MKRLLIITLSVFLLSACGKQNKSVSPLLHDETPAPVPEVGDFSENLKKLKKSTDLLDTCELNELQDRVEIAKSLDAHKDEILQIASKIPASGNYRSIPFGSSTLLEYIGPASSEIAWKTSQYSWKTAIKAFQLIKDKPVDLKWVIITAYLKNIIWDDNRRIYSGYNYGLDKDSKAPLQALLKLMNQCVQDSSCTDPQYQNSDLSFIALVPDYAKLKLAIEQETDASKKKSQIHEFQKKLNYDYQFFSMVKNQTLRFEFDSQKNLKNYILPLDGSIFNDDQKKIVADAIQTVWKKTDSPFSTQLLIEWNPSNLMVQIFKLFFNENQISLGKTFTDRKNFEIHINSSTSLKAIAHEAGHAIGFPDHYFTHWNPNTCTYINQVKDDDLMSMHETGIVTEPEWNDLYETYQKSAK